MARVPSAKAANSNTPMGPFQNTVLAPLIRSAKAAADSGSDVQADALGAEAAGLDGVGADRLVVGIGGELAGHHDVGGHDEFGAGVRGPLQVVLDDGDLVLFEQAARRPCGLRPRGR